MKYESIRTQKYEMYIQKTKLVWALYNLRILINLQIFSSSADINVVKINL